MRCRTSGTRIDTGIWLTLIKVCKTFMRRFDPGPRLQYFPLNPLFSALLAFSGQCVYFVLNRGQSAKMGLNRRQWRKNTVLSLLSRQLRSTACEPGSTKEIVCNYGVPEYPSAPRSILAWEKGLGIVEKKSAYSIGIVVEFAG